MTGNAAALAALYDRTSSLLFSLALRIVASRERAALVVEDLFDEVWRDRDGYRALESVPVERLISRCRELALAQVGLDEARDHRVAPPSLEPAPVEPDGVGFGLPHVPRMAAREALASLPERERRALEEAYFHGTNARDIAIRVGGPTTEAEVILRRALVLFRDHLAQPDALEIETRFGT